ncbi:amidohydrolase family protein [Frankia sp. CNm7]|uniref:Amidohydrolase family protein n=1 Tax=Frankia nepalensis TaxID=1836974 RepID=A0A937RHT4_9ACTN|nr:amidohydrolase family protein [Frankia nepalensis]MBL7496807.1 amidohydrolase family protein [Frankia nepalensis]MBL7513938.1 amidohydrolase family protein [Frankia nepalensis]MBL7523716.1 amidohydrolase family protein [Frankia nepalensis]MBL7626633.1 amidohydrolase family protein [Frankia nepalensis]
MHDVVIRGGEVVDGTGAPPRRADVAVDGGRVSEVGVVTGRGRRELDASGRLVTPGFVDIHTHLDAQLFWDPVASPSSWHGVTTVVLGNCGVTFAPVRPGQERYLAEMMESVEDIPANTIMTGLGWGWESYGDYLRVLEARRLGVNVGGLVGHCALRYYVMGERGLDDAPATDDDVATMAALVGEAVDAGALGFSTSRSFLHTVPDGRPVPGTFARPEELAAIAGALGARGRGTIEVVPRIGERDGPTRQNSVAELAWMEEVSRSSGRPLSFAITQSDRRPDLWSWVMEQVAAARARGADLRPQTSARGTGILYGLVGRTPYDALPAWAELAARPPAERLAAIGDPATRARLVAAADEPTNSAGPLAPKDPARLYLLPPGPAGYDVRPENSLAAEAARRGTSPAAAFLDFVTETGGTGLLYYPVLNQDLAAVAAMLTNPDVVVGVGDAGAHVALTMDAGQSTYFLRHWVRETGLLDVATAVRKLTGEGAALFGLRDRGVLAPGAHADINVLDLERLDLDTPQMRGDLPLGARRFVQRARGYDYTLVNGEVFIDHDELTDARAGQLVTAG